MDGNKASAAAQVAQGIYKNKQHLPIESGPQTRLIIVDRAVDAISGLIHDLHYQSLVHDSMVVEGNRVTFFDDSNKETTGELCDALWRDSRHLLYFEANEFVNEAFKSFKKENADAFAVQAGQRVNVDQLAQVGRSVFEFRQMQDSVCFI